MIFLDTFLTLRKQLFGARERGETWASARERKAQRQGTSSEQGNHMFGRILTRPFHEQFKKPARRNQEYLGAKVEVLFESGLKLCTEYSLEVVNESR